jgi:hypothetical protein
VVSQHVKKNRCVDIYDSDRKEVQREEAEIYIKTCSVRNTFFAREDEEKEEACVILAYASSLRN